MEIRRDKYLQDLINRMHNRLIKVVTGVRRSGKSYLIFHIFLNYLLKQGVPESHLTLSGLSWIRGSTGSTGIRTLFWNISNLLFRIRRCIIFCWMRCSF